MGLQCRLELAHLIGVLVDDELFASHALHDLRQLRLIRLHLVPAVGLQRSQELICLLELLAHNLLFLLTLIQLLAKLAQLLLVGLDISLQILVEVLLFSKLAEHFLTSFDMVLDCLLAFVQSIFDVTKLVLQVKVHLLLLLKLLPEYLLRLAGAKFGLPSRGNILIRFIVLARLFLMILVIVLCRI